MSAREKSQLSFNGVFQGALTRVLRVSLSLGE